MKHSAVAEDLFRAGFSCAQAVLCAFGDVTGFSKEESARLASSFGGGIGRMREVCGALSGALMVLGLKKGYSETDDSEVIRDYYHLVQSFAADFRKKEGSIICRELLRDVKVKEGNEPEERTEEYYRKRPCIGLVKTACDLLDEYLK